MLSSLKTSYFLKIYSLSVLSFLCFLFGLILFIDPIHYYRINEKITLYPHTRWQNAGLIKHCTFDTIIVGTSMTQNFNLGQINKELSCNVISLSLPGSDVQEQLLILRKAIETGKVKRVIWAIDRWCLGYAPGVFRSSFPIELYQNPVKGFFRYITSFEMALSAIYKFFKYYIAKKPKKSITEELQHINMWFRYPRIKFSKNIVLKEYHAIVGNKFQMITEEEVLETFKDWNLRHTQALRFRETKYDNFDNDVYRLIKSNPRIQFIIYTPPYSLAHQKKNYICSKDYFFEDYKFRDYIFSRLQNLSNVELYDFETVFEIICNLDNYKDVIHFSQKINDYMIRAFSRKEHLVIKENVQLYQNKFKLLPALEFR